jgi:hypothetical protein
MRDGRTVTFFFEDGEGARRSLRSKLNHLRKIMLCVEGQKSTQVTEES